MLSKRACVENKFVCGKTHGILAKTIEKSYFKRQLLCDKRGFIPFSYKTKVYNNFIIDFGTEGVQLSQDELPGGQK